MMIMMVLTSNSTLLYLEFYFILFYFVLFYFLFLSGLHTQHQAHHGLELRILR